MLKKKIRYGNTYEYDSLPNWKTNIIFIKYKSNESESNWLDDFKNKTIIKCSTAIKICCV